eukprot:579897-Hanusia_phi.AAC.2
MSVNPGPSGGDAGEKIRAESLGEGVDRKGAGETRKRHLEHCQAEGSHVCRFLFHTFTHSLLFC